jgi:hypothetical protein
MADEFVKTKPPVTLGFPSGRIGSDLLLFLQNLARVDPDGAAKRLGTIQIRCGLRRPGGAIHSWDAIDIIQDLVPDSFPQIRQFCRYPAKWDKDFGPVPAELPDYIELAMQIKADPVHSGPKLARMSSCPPALETMDIDILRTGIAAVTATAKLDQDAAITLSRFIKSPSDRSVVLSESFWELRALPFGRRAKLLVAAETAANSSPNRSQRIEGLSRVAYKAKQSYRRLQPWPFVFR